MLARVLAGLEELAARKAATKPAAKEDAWAQFVAELRASALDPEDDLAQAEGKLQAVLEELPRSHSPESTGQAA